MADLVPEGSAPVRFELLRQEQRGATIVRLEGELDLSNIEQVRVAVEPVIRAHPDHLIVEADGLTFADSSAIAALVGWAGVVGRLEIRDPPDLLRTVIQTMGLAQTLPMRP
jgi:anti-anti-sigma factor